MRMLLSSTFGGMFSLLLAGMSASGAAPNAGDAVFPFVLPWDDATLGVTDCSGWLAKPAGQAGHVRVGPGGHFYAGQERIRFLGVNVSFGGGFPAKSDAEKIAGRLAKFGVNVVRFHHMDTGKFPDGIRSASARPSGELEPEALDRLSYFIAQLQRHGIYANLNLLVGRPFNAADGLPAAIESLDWKDRHLIGFFDERHLALQQDYARRLLTHRNPYTKLTFASDPAVAFVEINNEQGLIHGWLGGQVDRLPSVFLDELQRAWNQWLKSRYATRAEVQRAWQANAQPVGAELLVNTDFRQALSHWTVEHHEGAGARVTVVEDTPAALRSVGLETKAARLEVQQPGPASWHVQFNQAGLRLEGNRAYTVRFWAKSDQARTLQVNAGQAHEPWSNLGLSGDAPLTTEWREFKFVFVASQSDTQARVNFSNFGPAGARTWLAGLSVRPGGVDGLKPGEHPAEGTVARFEQSQFGERTEAAQRDWLRFLQDTEDRYWQAMARYLEDDLKVQALIAGTIVGCSTPNLMARLDWVDTHSYWQHPQFPGRPWDSGNWLVPNRTMVNQRGGTLPGLALKRVLGKPHACTEYNHPAPNTYSSEGFLLLAAYAALQDWDAIYVYSYAHSRGGGWDSQKINSFFDIDQHPTKMATLPAAAAMFVRGDVSAARQLMVGALDREQEANQLRHARSWSLVDGGQAGLAREAALVHRVALATAGMAVPAGALNVESFNASTNQFISDTGELTWDVRQAGRGVVLVNTSRSKAVIGHGGGQPFALGDVSIALGGGLQEGWGAVTLTAMNNRDRPVNRWLVTATGYAENTGMKWQNAERSTVGRDWGQAPSRVEGVPVRIGFRVPANRVQAWALDGRGQPRQPVPVERDAKGNAVLKLGPQWQTLWYAVQVAE